MKSKTILFSAACAALLGVGTLLWGLPGDGWGAEEPGDPAGFITDQEESRDLPVTRERAEEPKRTALDAIDGPDWTLIGLVRTTDHRPIQVPFPIPSKPCNFYLIAASHAQSSQLGR